MKYLLTLILLLPCLHADEIVTITGKRYPGSEIVKIEGGYIYFVSQGNKIKRMLADIKDIIPAGQQISIVKLEDVAGKDPGKVLVLSIKDRRQRIYQPIVRVYTMTADERGSYELGLYQNVTMNDPTRLEKLEEVNSSAYRPIHYFMKRCNAFAFRVEVWIDGNLAFSENRNDEKLKNNWWRTQKVREKRKLTVMSQDDIVADKKDKVVESEVGTEIPKVNVKMSLLPRPAGNDVELVIGYRLHSYYLSDVKLPEVTLHYVTEAKGGEDRMISSLNIEDKRGNTERFSNKVINRNFNKKIKNVTFSSASEKVRRIIYWRMVVSYDGTAIASEEMQNPTVKKTLPENWWQD